MGGDDMNSLLRRFIYDYRAPLYIDGTGIQPDADLMQRNQERVAKVIAGMGPKYCLWNDRAAQDQDDMRAAHSHTEE